MAPDSSMRNKRLRRAILATVHEARISPTGWISARTVLDVVESSAANGQGIDSDKHGLSLVRDLVWKGLILERPETRRRGQAFGPDFLSLRIAAAGSALLNESAAPDPDIDDDRIVEGG